MSSRPEIAFVQCSTAIEMLKPVAARFAAVAYVLPLEASPDGSDAEALLPALTDAAPSAVVAVPRVTTALARGGVTAPIVPLALLPGLSVLEAVGAYASHAAGGQDARPVALDLYPLSHDAGGGCPVVVRDAPRPAAAHRRYPG